MRTVYMDHNATTPLRPAVLEAMLPYLKDEFGNASSLHVLGVRSRQAIEAARASVATLLGARSGRIVFTGCGTEADNQAVLGVALANQDRGDHIITSSIEHKAVLESCHYLERWGFRTTCLPVDRFGWVDPDSVREAITPRTLLVSVMFANNEVGTIQPIAEIARACRERGVWFHTDAIQAVGKMPVNVGELGVDLLSLSGHKFYGPKGIGALYVGKDIRIDPLLHGGSQEGGLRAATENAGGIVGLAKALELRTAEMGAEAERLAGLRDRLCEGLMAGIDRVYLNGHPSRRLPGTLNLSFAGTQGEALVAALDHVGVAASTGSACTSGLLQPSHVLLAMGLAPALAQGSLRFSLGRGNGDADVDHVLEALPPIVRRLRELSPFAAEA